MCYFSAIFMCNLYPMNEYLQKKGSPSPTEHQTWPGSHLASRIVFFQLSCMSEGGGLFSTPLPRIAPPCLSDAGGLVGVPPRAIETCILYIRSLKETRSRFDRRSAKHFILPQISFCLALPNVSYYLRSGFWTLPNVNTFSEFVTKVLTL